MIHISAVVKIISQLREKSQKVILTYQHDHLEQEHKTVCEISSTRDTQVTTDWYTITCHLNQQTINMTITFNIPFLLLSNIWNNIKLQN